MHALQIYTFLHALSSDIVDYFNSIHFRKTKSSLFDFSKF